MQQNLQHTIAILSRTPPTLNALLRDLPDAWTLSNEGGKPGLPSILSAISFTANSPTGCPASA